MSKKNEQLGMNVSTASGRLVRDLLFDFVQKAGIRCHHCGGNLTRETFSIEHKTPWLDSENPKELFFDLGNVSYSHSACNYAAAKRPHKVEHGYAAYIMRGCRCRICCDAKSTQRARYYTPEKRRGTYERTGK